MKIDDLGNLIFDKQYFVSDSFLKNYKNLNISDAEFIILLVIINYDLNVPIDYKKISETLNMNLTDIVEKIHSLTDKKIIEIVVKKSKNNIISEFVSLDLLKYKLTHFVMDKSDKKDNSKIYSLFESEFGRPISPLELDALNNFLQKYTSDKIMDALKEASLSGVNNMKYIEKILQNNNFKNINKSEVKETKKDIFSYDWLNE
ncbi:MAG: DnaD domain-containing protein [Bacilli bacterium]